MLDAVAATAFAPGHISPCSCMPMCMVSVCSYNVQGHPPFNVATKRFNKHDVGTSLGGLCRECAGRRDVQSTCHMPPSPHKAVHCTVPMQTKSIEGPEYHVAYRDTTAQETRRSTKVSKKDALLATHCATAQAGECTAHQQWHSICCY